MMSAEEMAKTVAHNAVTLTRPALHIAKLLAKWEAAIRDDAVAGERERCAKVAADFCKANPGQFATPAAIATAIQDTSSRKLGGVSDLAIAADEQKGEGLTPEEIEEQHHEEEANDYRSKEP